MNFDSCQIVVLFSRTPNFEIKVFYLTNITENVFTRDTFAKLVKERSCKLRHVRFWPKFSLI